MDSHFIKGIQLVYCKNNNEFAITNRYLGGYVDNNIW